MTKVLGYGEILIRLSPKLGGTWLREATVPAYVGGAELNTVTALANWGIEVGYCTALPTNFLSEEIKLYLENKKIDTSTILTNGQRIGIYLLPQGNDMKSEGVIYDRANSAFALLTPNSIDWSTILENTSWLHISAISPALSADAAAVTLEVVKAASERNIHISIDLNFRAKLWQYGKQPTEIMPEIARYANLIMGNIWSANALLGISMDEKVAVNEATKEDYLRHAERTAREIRSNYPKCEAVANTFRFDFNKTGIEYYTTLFVDEQQYVSPHFYRETIVDKIGSGDCFMAGLIYGFIHRLPPQSILNYATSAAICKLNELGDATSQNYLNYMF